MDKDHTLDELMGKLGDFGKYQGFQFFLHIMSALTAGMHMLSLVTVAAVPDHRCYIPEIDAGQSSHSFNITELSKWIPLKDNHTYDSCRRYDGGSIVPCSSYVYDTTYRSSSRGMEWDFVCSNRWKGQLAQSIYMFGVFAGAVVLGGMADKYGRKKIFCLSGILQLILGVTVAFIPEYWTFLVFRFIYGIFGSAGSYITGFVLTMEIVGPGKRTACGVAFQATFAGGIILVAAWGALIDNRQILQIVYGLHALIFIPHIWIMDESPQWLWLQGRYKESLSIIQKALKMNGSNETLDIVEYLSKGRAEASKTEEAPQAGISHLFLTPRLRLKTLNVCLCWFANSIAYYGLSLSSGKLAGNPYLILAIMGFVEMPSYALVVFTLDILGRRPLTSSMMIIGGIACIVATNMPAGSTISTGIVLVGKFFIAGSFAIIYNYSAELFPTVVRNTALGLGSMCARLSGALTPMITLLDSFDPKIPAVVFAVLALISGFLVLFLPETMGKPMPQTIQDGEDFGVGDTCFTMFSKSRKNRTRPTGEKQVPEAMVPLSDVKSTNGDPA